MTATMATMAEVFSAFRAFLAQQDTSQLSFLEYVSSCMENTETQQLGYAFLKHSVDILRQDAKTPWPDVYAECFRRVFFDPIASELYGTEEMCFTDVDQARSFVDHHQLRHSLAERGAHVHPMATA